MAHKTMEVRAHLALEWQALIEVIHEVGFTAPHPAPKIQTLNRLNGLVATKRARPNARFLCVRIRRYQPFIEPLQLFHSQLLRGVVTKTFSLEVILVTHKWGLVHGQAINAGDNWATKTTISACSYK
jgi:hypothetical protein